MIEYVARQVKVAPVLFGMYDWAGRSVKHHRAQIRKEHGFREATRGDEAKLTRWLAEEGVPSELSDLRLREELLGRRCRAERVEIPTAAAEAFCARTVARLGDDVSGRRRASSTTQPGVAERGPR